MQFFNAILVSEIFDRRDNATASAKNEPRTMKKFHIRLKYHACHYYSPLTRFIFTVSIFFVFQVVGVWEGANKNHAL